MEKYYYYLVRSTGQQHLKLLGASGERKELQIETAGINTLVKHS